MALINEFKKQGNLLFKYRGQIPILLLIPGLLIFYLNLKSNDLYFPAEISIYYEIFCVFISLIGLVIRSIVIGTVPKNTSGRNTKGQIADTINKSGIYSTLRHPLYLGNFFLWLGPVIYTQSISFTLVFVLAYCIYYERIMFAEETFLIDKFDDEYLDWSLTTPAIIPNFKNYISSKLDFSIRNVIKREYYAIIELFLVFFLFQVIEDLYFMNEIDFANSWQDIAFYISVILFIVIRLIAKKTNILSIEGR